MDLNGDFGGVENGDFGTVGEYERRVLGVVNPVQLLHFGLVREQGAS